MMLGLDVEDDVTPIWTSSVHSVAYELTLAKRLAKPVTSYCPNGGSTKRCEEAVATCLGLPISAKTLHITHRILVAVDVCEGGRELFCPHSANLFAVDGLG
jgi:hypothetical protein